ncbi:MAG: head maturation protease, ClpP-related [Flavipsychrobacter sp.]
MSKFSFYVVNKAPGTTAEIYMYGYIGNNEDMNTALFVSTLRDLYRSNNEIKLYINSGGGSVYEGMALVNVLKECGDKITGYVEGIAASMAFVLSQVLNKCYISKYGRAMSHRAQGGCWGNADEMRAMADEIESVENELVKVVATKTGLSDTATREKYFGNTDRWINAEQAVKEGLYAGIYDGTPINAPANMQGAEELVNHYSQTLVNQVGTSTTKDTIIILL